MPPKHWRKKKDAPHIGKLMIVLRNRHVVWIDMGPEIGIALRKKITALMCHLDPDLDQPYSIDLAPFSEDTVRIEDIVHVRYIGPRDASVSEPEPKAKSEA